MGDGEWGMGSRKFESHKVYKVHKVQFSTFYFLLSTFYFFLQLRPFSPMSAFVI